MEVTREYFRMLRDKASDKEVVAYYLKHMKAITDNAALFFKDTETKFYYYLCTFILNPSIQTDQYDTVENYIKKQFTDRGSLGVKESHIVREYTKAGVAHWHVSVQTDRPLKKDRFNYYEKLYGKMDISKNKAQNLEDGKNYISKSNTPEVLVSGNDLTLPETQKGTKGYSKSMFLDFDS